MVGEVGGDSGEEARGEAQLAPMQVAGDDEDAAGMEQPGGFEGDVAAEGDAAEPVIFGERWEGGDDAANVIGERFVSVRRGPWGDDEVCGD